MGTAAQVSTPSTPKVPFPSPDARKGGSNVFQCLVHKCLRKSHHGVTLGARILFTASLGATFTLKTKC